MVSKVWLIVNDDPQVPSTLYGDNCRRFQVDAVLFRRSGWEDQNFCFRETELRMSFSHPSKDVIDRQKCVMRQ